MGKFILANFANEEDLHELVIRRKGGKEENPDRQVRIYSLYTGRLRNYFFGPSVWGYIFKSEQFSKKFF